jgi:hypothetical protein
MDRPIYAGVQFCLMFFFSTSIEVVLTGSVLPPFDQDVRELEERNQQALILIREEALEREKERKAEKYSFW